MLLLTIIFGLALLSSYISITTFIILNLEDESPDWKYMLWAICTIIATVSWCLIFNLLHLK